MFLHAWQIISDSDLYSFEQVVRVDHVLDAGFLSVTAMVEGCDKFSGHQVKLIAKNEYYIARYFSGNMTGDPVLACTPDLICVIDSDKGRVYLKCHSLLTYELRDIMCR